MNREIYQYELPWNALQLNSEDIYLSMGVGYVPDEEMLKQLDLLKKEIAVRCRPRCLYAFFEASPATKKSYRHRWYGATYRCSYYSLFVGC